MNRKKIINGKSYNTVTATFVDNLIINGPPIKGKKEMRGNKQSKMLSLEQRIKKAILKTRRYSTTP
jgi:hypothetical protein